MNNKIDFHTHYLPTEYVNALSKHIDGDPDGWPTPKWNIDTTLDFMQDNGIAYSVLSLSSPHINFNDKQETIQLADDSNKLGFKLTTKYQDKIGYLASLPIPYEDDSVDAINKAFSEYQALGVTVPTNSLGTYFGSPTLDKVYQRLDDLNAIVALHPNKPSELPQNVNDGLPIPLLGFFMDTTMTFMNLLKFHFFDRFPNIRLIVPHAGAFLDILTDRVADYVLKVYGTDIYEVIQHVYFDTAGRVLPRQLPDLLTMADENHILYGSDIPYTPLAGASSLRGSLENTDRLSTELKQKIFRDNALKLLNM